MKGIMKRLCVVFAMLALAAPALAPARAWADVKIDAENFPDENFRNWVKENAAGGGDVLKDKQIAAAEEMDLSGVGGISSLKGLEHFTALNRLNCSGNKLKELDLSKNPALMAVFCWDNELTALDLSKNPALEVLSCGGNKIAELDLSKNAALTGLYCRDNKLVSLRLAKDGALVELRCEENELTELDLSGHPALEELSCFGNELTALDFSNNLALRTISCWNNKLTALDLSHNPALDVLYCSGNKLTALDLTRNTDLTEIDCGGNALTELDLSKNGKLEEADLPAAAQVTLPNGDRIDMANFQLRRTAGGKYQLDLSKYAGKIEEVKVTSEPDEDENEDEEKDVEVTSSGRIYTFEPCDGSATISYKLGEREGEGWLLSLLLNVTKDTSSVPLTGAKADPDATEDIDEDAGGKPGAQAKTGYVLRDGKVYRVDGGKERLLENVEPQGISTEAGLWAWIMIDPETDGMEGSESGVQFFLGEDASPAGFLPVEDVEICAVHFSSLGDKLLIVAGAGSKQDVGFYLVDAANGGFVKKKSFASMGPAAWVDAHRFFFSAIDESKGFVGGHEGIWWASPSLYDTAEDEAIVIRKATATRNSAIIDYDPEAGTLTIMEMSVEDEKDWPDEDKVEFQELTLSIPAAG